MTVSNLLVYSGKSVGVLNWNRYNGKEIRMVFGNYRYKIKIRLHKFYQLHLEGQFLPPYFEQIRLKEKLSFSFIVILIFIFNFFLERRRTVYIFLRFLRLGRRFSLIRGTKRDYPFRGELFHHFLIRYVYRSFVYLSMRYRI